MFSYVCIPEISNGYFEDEYLFWGLSGKNNASRSTLWEAVLLCGSYPHKPLDYKRKWSFGWKMAC